jgi:hypothetical protein
MCRKCSCAGQAPNLVGKRSSDRPDPLPTPSMTVWFLPLEDLSLQKIGAPSTFDLNLILIKWTVAQSFIAQQVIRLSATQQCGKAPRPFEKRRLMPFMVKRTRSPM